MPFEVLKSLKVLMWKHLMVRGRKYILTSMELLLPLVYFLLIHLICLHFANKRLFPIMIENMQITNLQDTESHPQNETKRDHRYLDLLLYTPDTNSTRQLMDEVGPQLNLDRLDQLSVDSLNTKKYVGVKNESFFNTFLTTKKNLKFDKFAIVIFHNVENTLPSHLRYTIKINEESYIHGYQSMYFLMNSHKNFDNDHLLFMRVQWAIDSSYLELQGVDIKKLKLSVHEVDVSSQKKLDRETISVMVHIACVMSLYIPFVLLMVKLLQERCSGVQELMKIMGVSANLLDLSHFLDVLPTGLVFSISGTVFLTVGKIAVIPDTDPLLIFIMLLLYFISVMAFAFAFSYIAKTERNLPILDIFVQHNPGSGSVFASYVMFILQTIIFAFISWYLNKVRPGKYGTALPYTFLFKAQFWSIKKVALITMDKEYMTTITKDRDPLYFEKPPPSAEIGIRITNLTKVYNEQKVLDNVSFDVYKGEITVLLGHNGAGKTTLMSIITGVICATEGTVTVYGLDTVQHQKQVRKLIGLCPQDNIFFPHLTVLEHVMFCAMLKGANRKAAKEFCLELLDRLKIADKANNKSEQLSGGMKRRLQLACALAGRGNVLILDEPTSGLDIKTRRELWNLLLSLRGERTVLLTTHFMEEADALGDHVATLNGGQLRALATPIYLKKNLGTGYRLSLKTIGLPQKKAITRLVMTYVPEATLKEIGLDTLEYSLPSTSSNFSTLLTQLENERSKLRIDSIGVGVSTLEEVFTKLCSDIETSFTEDTFDDELQESSYPIVMGYYLLWNQFLVLLLRRIKSMYCRKWNFFFMQVLIPILLIFAMTYMTNDPVKSDDEDHKTTMNFSMFRDMHQLKVFYKLDYKNREFLKTFRPFGNVEFEETSNIIDVRYLESP
ncbi:ATP-binding cassette sub-family A member 3-like [Hyposmocoma kahamanoa]|uniref:ATP-binding cassette sub-family A member 3-like n=1 Tax=Hyposmocoma kahamanoa TaxID=1477025 RepID=UPI000E6D6B23|nr:ATP-binding cassette sub-family A member 3-like [Hyposmocoma kahamanoa]